MRTYLCRRKPKVTFFNGNIAANGDEELQMLPGQDLPCGSERLVRVIFKHLSKGKRSNLSYHKALLLLRGNITKGKSSECRGSLTKTGDSMKLHRKVEGIAARNLVKASEYERSSPVLRNHINWRTGTMLSCCMMG